MNVDWVGQQLLRSNLPQQLRRAVGRRGLETGHSRSHQPKLYIIGERMVSGGCTCLLVQSGKTAAPSKDAAAATVSTWQDEKALPSSQRRRVVLPGMLPKTVVVTKPEYFSFIVDAKRLPPPSHCARVSAASPQRHNSTPLQPLPCPNAASGTCRQCPWMAPAMASRSSFYKSQLLQRSLQRTLRDLPEGRGHRSGDTAMVSRRESWNGHDDQSLRSSSPPLQLMEPFTISAKLGYRQGLQFILAPKKRDSAATPCSSPSAPRPTVEVIIEGFSAAEAVGDLAADSVNASARYSSSCMLMTLEQHRLVTALRAWASEYYGTGSPQEQSPLLVCISQPSLRGALNPWDSSLHVTVVVRRSGDTMDVCSPLCGPSHPSDLLSNAEQMLVDAVLGAAPLIKAVEISVAVASSPFFLSEHGDGATDAAVHTLYPRLRRDFASLRDYRSFLEGGEAAMQQLECWCHPLGQSVDFCLPVSHPSLRWLSTTERQHQTYTVSATAPPMPFSLLQRLSSVCVDLFWRHPSSLDACCSVLLSCLLDGLIPTTSTTVSSGAAPIQLLYGSRSSGDEELFQSGLQCDSGEALTAERRGAIVGQWMVEDAIAVILAKLQNRMRHLFRTGATTRSVDGCAGSCDGDERLLSSAPLSTSRPSSTVAVLSVSSTSSNNRGGESDGVASLVRALLRRICTGASQKPMGVLRLFFFSCSASMDVDGICQAVSAVVTAEVNLPVSILNISAGVVDADPLSSSFVAYCTVDLSCDEGAADLC